MRKFVLISRYCETDWARKSSRSGGWSPRRLRGGQLLGTRAGRLHSGVLPRWPLGPEEESTAQEGGTRDQPEQEPGRWGLSCMAPGEWLSGSELGCLSLEVLPTGRENSTCGLPSVSPCTLHIWLASHYIMTVFQYPYFLPTFPVPGMSWAQF